MTGGARMSTEEVRAMFDGVAPVYELMNTLMTLGIDRRWRRAAVRAAGLQPGERVLDVACGTGQLTRAAAAEVGATGETVGIDLSPRMIERASRRGGSCRFVVGDAMALPFADAGFDAVTLGFGLRNMPDFRRALGEMARVSAPGGRVIVLELAIPTAGLARVLYATWFRRIVPMLGRLARRRGAYRYLPLSVGGYPPPVRIAELMREAGLDDVRWSRLTGGFVTLHRGVRA